MSGEEMCRCACCGKELKAKLSEVDNPEADRYCIPCFKKQLNDEGEVTITFDKFFYEGPVKERWRADA